MLLRVFKIIFMSLLVAGSLSLSATPADQLNVDEQLRFADSIKSTEPTKFKKLLIYLSENQDKLNIEQLEFLQYLESYHLVISGRKNEAIDKLKALLESSKKDVIKLKSLGIILNVLAVSRNYSEVFKYYDTFTDLLSKTTDELAISHGLTIISLVFLQINQFDISAHYAQNLIESTSSDRYRCIGIQYKLEAFHKTERFSDFNDLYQEGLDSCQKAGEIIYSNIIRSFRVEQLIEVQPQQAIALLDNTYSEVEATAYTVLIALYKTLYATAYFRNGELSVSKSYADSAVDMLQPDDVNYAVLLLYSTLYEIAKAQHEYEQALKFNEILVSKQKAYDDEKAAGLLAYNIAKANVEVQNQRIALLDKDNELLYLKKNAYEQEVKQTRIMMAVLTIVLSIASVLAYKGLTGSRRFKKIAEYDQLTGISNRYHFNNQAAVALSYCEKNAKPVAVILFDLDHFKHINDIYGHAAGDWALQSVVKACRNFMRNNDVFGRIGGEEFAIVLPGCQSDKALMLAEICRDAIAAIDTAASGTAFSLTASFGVSGADTSGYLLKQLLADADAAMYQAKAAGRDQVVQFTKTDA